MYPLIFLYALSALFLTMVIKQDALILMNFLIIGGIFSFLLIKKELLLLSVTILAAIFHEGISSIINGTYIMMGLYTLMIVSLLVNKRRIELAPSVLVFIVLALLLSLAPILVTESSIPIVIISIIKRFGFLIVFVFALNIAELHQKHGKMLNRIIIGALIANFFLAFFQFFQGSYNRDDITGLLGENTTGIFIYLFMFYLAIICAMHFKHKISIIQFSVLTLIPIIYSAIAEVKIGFVSIAILLIIYLVFINKGVKSLILLIAISFVFSWTYALFVSIYPEHDFVNANFLDQYLVGDSYDGHGSINRFGFKAIVDTTVFEDKSSEIAFGKGLGSGNPSEMEMLKGEVYRNFNYLKYSWFTLPYLYIETGWAGTTAYILIYIIPFLIAVKEFKKEGSLLAVVLILMGITNFIFLPYNAGLFNYGVTTIYWIYVAMLISDRRKKEKAIILTKEVFPDRYLSFK